MNDFRTEQEAFWAGEFGDDYIDRNSGTAKVENNCVIWKEILDHAPDARSIIEFGCNIGLNLQAIKRVRPDSDLVGYEINKKAAGICNDLGIGRIENASCIDRMDEPENGFDLAFTKGVLIHINPEALPVIYDQLHRLSRRYIVVCEYYNPSPMVVNYRDNTDRLFKRDFAGELMDRFDLELVRYGFVYHRDPQAPQDDITWFLLEKR